jgi:hypothetical protein
MGSSYINRDCFSFVARMQSGIYKIRVGWIMLFLSTIANGWMDRASSTLRAASISSVLMLTHVVLPRVMIHFRLGRVFVHGDLHLNRTGLLEGQG